MGIEPDEKAEEVERLAKLLFVWNERDGGNEAFSISDKSVEFWFSQGPEARGEDADCYRHCQELRRQARWLVSEFAALGAKPDQ